MKLVELKCTSCGANLKVNPNLDKAQCNYCGKEVIIDHSDDSTIDKLSRNYEKMLDKNQEYLKSNEYKDVKNVALIFLAICFVILILVIILF